MSDIEDIKSISNPRLTNRDGKPTWLICVIKREYSTYTSTRVLNGNHGNEDSPSQHPEAKFFDLWWKNPRKIFPDLPFNEIDKIHFHLIWYTLTSPCNNCVQLIKGNHHLYNTLNIFTASVYKNLKDNSIEASNRIYELRRKGVGVEPISEGEYQHFTTGRVGHELPQLPFFNPEQDFIDLRISFTADTTITTDRNPNSFETRLSPRYDSINQHLVPITNERTVLIEPFPYQGSAPSYHPQLPNTYPSEEDHESVTNYKVIKRERSKRKLKRLKRKNIFIEDN
ncbi:hypothetical protein LOD99_3760 [Oopsacas minuta]|uniref:Activation-induced cytidine deaminase AID domain-containing protein n=1 Tax=Oopsacas minuta TaxID=111878 RepID=A0AAV7JWS3_9METZ|nr:hypothetical protein LOD99_3760 [Oopsacas minuta]